MLDVLWGLVTAGALLSSGVAAEYSARCWLRLRRQYYPWPPGFRLHRYTDQETLPELEPLARIEINRDGERGNEIPRDQSYYRVLVAGGSAAECDLLDQPTSWPGVLQRHLEVPENLKRLGVTRVHVGNIGRSGVDSRALALTLERVLPRYRHCDVIVIMVGVSNIYGWVSIGAPSDGPSPALPISEFFSCHPEGPFGWSPKQTALFELLKRWRWRWLRPVKARQGSGKWLARARIMRAQAKEVRTHMPDPTVMLDHFQHDLQQLLQRAKDHSNRVLVVLQPWFEKDDYTPEELAHFWHGGVGDASLGDKVTVFYDNAVMCRLFAMMNARAAQVARDLGVECLDLMPLVEPSLKTFYDFSHFTPAGAADVAAAVASVIIGETCSQVPVVARSSNDLA